jgi:protein-S-isoprenylcysteine O-methyltransferase Ste14
VGLFRNGLDAAAHCRGLLSAWCGAVENLVPRRLVVEEPYRYVRKPLYVTDFA